MYLKKIVFVSFVGFCLATPNFAFAHGGGLDRTGGHYNHRTGEYHCHRSPCFEMRNTRSRAVVPIRQGVSYQPQNIYFDNRKVKTVQALLISLGYNVDANGISGPKTQAAILNFNSNRSYHPSSRVDDNLVLALALAVQEQILSQS